MRTVVWHRLSKEHLLSVIDAAGPEALWVMDTETNGLEVRGSGSPHWAHWIGLMPVGKGHCFIVSRDEYDEWELELTFKRMVFVGHNLRFDCHALDLVPERLWIDTLLPLYYGNTACFKGMDHVAKVYGWPSIPTPAALKQGKVAEMDEVDLCDYLANDLLVTSLMYQKFGGKIREECQQLEMATLRMENRGLRLLPEPLGEVESTVNQTLADLEHDLEIEGVTSSILTSPTKIGQWLVDNGRTLPKTKKTKKPRTDSTSLQRLVDNGDMTVVKILEHRKTLKLRTSFTRPLASFARSGMLYPETRTTSTVTGRFSCAVPNLQQIPKRGPVGKAIRSCITSKENIGITACDYGQVELRVAAALAKEPVLLEAFSAGRCPHREVAGKMLGKRPDEITEAERFKAKAVNFGILNGMGAKRLAVDLKSTKPFAQRFLDDYLSNLHVLDSWMQGVWTEAEAYRLVRNCGGRTRIFSNNDDTRPGISMIVQGTAAEMMRKALIAADGAGLEPLLSVHDELLIAGTSKAQGAALQEVMENSANNAFPSDLGAVHFTAEATSGPTWGDV